MTGTLLRLRPIVHATPTDNGLHVRGWSASFTLDGGTGLWTLWEAIAPKLAEGMPVEEFAVPPGAPPSVAKALRMIIEQLRAHDFVVEVPAEWGADAPPEDVCAWLESVAADPLDAWRRLRAARIEISGDGVVAAAARRALAGVGLTVDAPSYGTGLTLTGGEHSVRASAGAEVGYVLPVDGSEELTATGTAPEVLATLVGCAAAHRLVCAIGGLPDPATEFVELSDADRSAPEGLFVLVARLDPLRADYHPWLPAHRPLDPPTEPAQIVKLLVDSELGPVPTPDFGDLPQLPANVAISGDALGVGAAAEDARLDAARLAVQAAVGEGVIVGIGAAHALGLALRHAARELPGLPVGPDAWADDPTARRWWKALTLRFALPAICEVNTLADGVYRAEIRTEAGPLSWAVEARAADAVSFAALAAVGHAQVGRSGPAPLLCGAAPVSSRRGEPPAGWLNRDWHWPLEVSEAEPGFQDLLLSIVDKPEPVSLGAVFDSAGVVGFRG
ncbi:MAG TPA: hypothetical protein VJ914_06570 [Pseudonocardiaceae bacterium]|nr:hypothetical protein [Pseudonocardiaceae bacterium]